MTDSRRVDILGATATAIAERGLCETRTADVAEIVRVSPALVLNYYPNKAAMVTEAPNNLDRLFSESVAETLDSALLQRLIVPGYGHEPATVGSEQRWLRDGYQKDQHNNGFGRPPVQDSSTPNREAIASGPAYARDTHCGHGDSPD